MAAAPAHADLLAHRAVYELKLLKTSGTHAPTSVRGLIAYDFSGSSCDGYTTNFRQMIELGADEGAVHVTDIRSTTFEDAAFKTFRFKVSAINDGVQGDDIDGSASRSADGSLAVQLKKPKATKLSFAAGVAFPTEHVENIIAAAKAGQTTLSRQVYDGSDSGEKLFDTLTVISKPTTTTGDSFADTQDALKTVSRWPVTISYFEVGHDSDKPSYILSFDLYENGVSRNMKLDYGDFVLQGEMTNFVVSAKSACGK
eukprot:gene13929-14046_t